MRTDVRVVKLGGSLLWQPHLPGRFRAWLAEQPPRANVLVVGGGAFVEGLRELDRAQNLHPSTVHWMAIRALGIISGAVAELLSARLVRVVGDLQLRPPSTEILDVEQFLRGDAVGRDPLPESWEVTSDSIAARLAVRLNAGELVLLKSAPPPGDGKLDSLAAAGYVDAWFPRAASGLTVRYVCLAHEQGQRRSVPGARESSR
jgi:aspartokinase-like uncharacterized kinase